MLVVLVLAGTEIVFLIVAHIVPYFGSMLKNSVDNVPMFLILMNSASTELRSFLLLTLPVTVFVFPTPY